MQDIPGHEGRYAATKDGKIWSFLTQRFLKTSKNNEGYNHVSLHISGHSNHKFYLVHRLVANTFLPNPDNLLEINHKNLNKDDNSVSNIEWCTRMQNSKHAVNNGRQVKGETVGLSKLKADDVITIRAMKKRGVPTSIVSSRFKIHRGTVNKIVNHKLWKHI